MQPIRPRRVDSTGRVWRSVDDLFDAVDARQAADAHRPMTSGQQERARATPAPRDPTAPTTRRVRGAGHRTGGRA